MKTCYFYSLYDLNPFQLFLLFIYRSMYNNNSDMYESWNTPIVLYYLQALISCAGGVRWASTTERSATACTVRLPTTRRRCIWISLILRFSTHSCTTLTASTTRLAMTALPVGTPSGLIMGAREYRIIAKNVTFSWTYAIHTCTHTRMRIIFN